jgi:septal ring factor EnvC (AmiA/AmiB activator)
MICFLLTSLSAHQDLLSQLKKGHEEISQLNRDLAAERKSRSNFQLDVEKIELTLGQLERKIVSPTHHTSHGVRIYSDPP